MTTPAPLTPAAVERVCDADHVAKTPFQKMTRADTAVGIGMPPTLHGWRNRFDLWDAVTNR